MESFFVLVLLGLLAASAWAALSLARRCEAAAADAEAVSKDG